MGKKRSAETKVKAVTVLGIDPGVSGALVLLDGEKFASYSMPVIEEGKERRADFRKIREMLTAMVDVHAPAHVFLERAVSFGMGTKSAFSYGRGFEALVIALEMAGLPYTLVEPGKWAKEMHAGISGELKPKAKSVIALRRLYPKFITQLPQKPKGGVHDGAVDAILIAAYGLRHLGLAHPAPEDDVGDFY